MKRHFILLLASLIMTTGAFAGASCKQQLDFSRLSDHDLFGESITEASDRIFALRTSEEIGDREYIPRGFGPVKREVKTLGCTYIEKDIHEVATGRVVQIDGLTAYAESRLLLAVDFSSSDSRPAVEKNVRKIYSSIRQSLESCQCK